MIYICEEWCTDISLQTQKGFKRDRGRPNKYWCGVVVEQEILGSVFNKIEAPLKILKGKHRV